MIAEPIAALLAPISEDAPFGTYLKADRALYRALRNRFNAAQTSYRALSETVESLGDRELQTQNREAWQALSDEAQKVLTEHSRDLEVFCWYVAAQIHLEAPLLRLLSAVLTVTELVNTSWEQLQPIPPVNKLRAEDEASQSKEIDALRLRSFVQLIGEVPGSGLLHLPLTNLPLIGRTTYGAFLAAERDGTVADLKHMVAGEIEEESAALPDRVLQLAELQETLARLDESLRLVALRSGETPVQVARLSKQVGDLLRAMRVLTEGTAFAWPIVEQSLPETEDVPGDAPESAEGGAIPDNAPVQGITGSGDAVTREAALSSLEALIAHFRATEPHSPIHSLLSRALRWARMPLPDVMAEVLGVDSEAMVRLSMMAGLESVDERLSQPDAVVAPVAAPVSPHIVSALSESPEAETQKAVDPPQEGKAQDTPPSTEGQITSFEW